MSRSCALTKGWRWLCNCFLVARWLLSICFIQMFAFVFVFVSCSLVLFAISMSVLSIQIAKETVVLRQCFERWPFVRACALGRANARNVSFVTLTSTFQIFHSDNSAFFNSCDKTAFSARSFQVASHDLNNMKVNIISCARLFSRNSLCDSRCAKLSFSIGHFRVPLILSFKASLSGKFLS